MADKRRGSIVVIFGVLLAVGVLGAVGCSPANEQENDPVGVPDDSRRSGDPADLAGKVSWTFDGTSWSATGTPPACPTPVLQTPVDLAMVTSILYPGQTRGGNYKAHGGFGFADGANTATVKAPMDAEVTKAARYIEQGETQYLLVFTAPCGIMYRFDHLLTLTEKLQQVMEKLPAAQPDDSRTTDVSDVSVAAGETIATAVGFARSGNAGVDFGVYDLRQQNEASRASTYAAAHATFKETEYFGVCWFDLLSAADGAKVRSLPARDAASGKTSDYCR